MTVELKGERESIIISGLKNLCAATHAKIEPVSIFRNMSPDCVPICCKSKKFSKSEENFIASQIKCLLEEGKIEESFGPWRSQVLVTTEGRHKRRMVVDYSRTVNKYTFVDAYPLPKLDEVANKIAQHKVYSAYDLSSACHQIPIMESEREMTAFEALGRLYQWTCVPFGVGNGCSAFQ